MKKEPLDVLMFAELNETKEINEVSVRAQNINNIVFIYEAKKKYKIFDYINLEINFNLKIKETFNNYKDLVAYARHLMYLISLVDLNKINRYSPYRILGVYTGLGAIPETEEEFLKVARKEKNTLILSRDLIVVKKKKEKYHLISKLNNSLEIDIIIQFVPHST